MAHAPSDPEILARSLRDPQAFEALVERHFRAIHRYLHRRAGRDVADELAAQTFALAFEHRARCRLARDSALPWLYGIATRLLRRARRTETRRLRAYARTGVDRWTRHEDESDARLDARSLGPELAAALAAMRPRERDALLLYALADLSYEQVALALDVPVGTVRTWLHRARQVARERLEAAETRATPNRGVDLDGRAGAVS